MGIAELLSSARRKGARLWVNGGALYYQAPESGLVPEELQEIRARKPEVIQFLSNATIDQEGFPPLIAKPRPDMLPLSFAQERLWFLSQFQGFKSVYCMPTAWRLRGPLNLVALKFALTALVQRHESLRTRFEIVDAKPCQIIVDTHEFALEVHDLSAVGEVLVHQAIRSDVERPFDIEAGPLFRATAFVLGAEHHVLLLNMHHIVSDGWSMQVIARELGELYASAVEGRDSALPAPEIQYCDYALWQREWLQGDIREQQLGYWKARLGVAPPALTLPTDRSRPAEPSFKGASYAFELDVGVATAITQFCRGEKVTIFMFLLAAFKAVLARWSGQSDICVGSPIAGRADSAAESLVGFFVGTLALRTDLSGAPSFREALARVKATALDAYRHQDIPFDQLVKELQPKRDLHRTPFFQVMFALQTGLDAAPQLPGITATAWNIDVTSASFDLTLTATQCEGGLSAVIEYATDLFDARSAERFAGHLKVLINAALEQPGLPISDLPMLTPAETEELIGVRPADQYDDERTLLSMFDAQVAARPDAIAIVCQNESVSYADLDARANKLARQLHQLGIGPDSIVGLCVERSSWMIVAMLAILKSGGAYLPLDPAYPADRLEYILEDARAPVILTEVEVKDRLPCEGRHVICLDSEWSQIEQQPGSAMDTVVHADNLAYVIYTSGSTGRPKGTLITHRNVQRLFATTESQFGFDHRDVWTLFHSYAFDFSVWEIFGALLYGGRLVIVPHMLTRSTELFFDLLKEQGVTVLNQTPSAFRMLMREAEHRAESDKLRDLRYVIFGGEALDPRSIAAWYSVYPNDGPLLVNMYGITETTVHVTYRAMEASDTRQAHSPIGLPIPDLRIYVLDERLRPVPVGVAGEMYVAGPGLARGYLDRPALTAERFVPNPFSRVAGDRLYKTGDLARWTGNGALEFIGRNDHQVKLRGFRIELGEIEASILQAPGVSQAVVQVIGTGSEDQRLVAWVVAKPGISLEVEGLRAHLADALPAFMVPSNVVLLDRMPLTVNGKIDRAAMPIPDLRVRAIDTESVAPRNAIEQVLVTIWSETLGVDVGVRDNFFAVGGDSIRAVQVVRAVNAKNLSCTVEQLFRFQTVEGMAASMEAVGDRRPAAPAMRLLERSRDESDLPPGTLDVYPVTGMQRVMIDQYSASAAEALGVYHVQQSFRFVDPNPAPAAMRCAIAVMISTQPILRTAFFAEPDGTLVQVIRSDAAVPFSIHDISHLLAPQQEHFIQDLVKSDRLAPFQAFGAHAELIRFHWIALANDRFELMMSIHHAIDDGWGNGHFLQCLFNLYLRIKGGEAVLVTPADNVFKEYVAIEHEIAESAEARAFWASMNLEAMVRPGTSVPDAMGRAGAWSVTLPVSLGQAVRAYARKAGVSIKAVFLDAFLSSIAQDSGRSRPTVGVVANGRTDRLSDPLQSLGLFWNMAPFAVQNELSGIDRLRAVQQQLADMEPYASYPLQKIRELCGNADPFYATFNFVNFHNAVQFDQAGELTLQREMSHDRFHFPLNMFLSVGAENEPVALRVEYHASSFSQSEVQQLVETYIGLLHEPALAAISNTAVAPTAADVER